jgi:Skp family chaperone for outer membrane proteins
MHFLLVDVLPQVDGAPSLQQVMATLTDIRKGREKLDTKIQKQLDSILKKQEQMDKKLEELTSQLRCINARYKEIDRYRYEDIERYRYEELERFRYEEVPMCYLDDHEHQS